jgi:hypothetical protein
MRLADTNFPSEKNSRSKIFNFQQWYFRKIFCPSCGNFFALKAVFHYAKFFDRIEIFFCLTSTQMELNRNLLNLDNRNFGSIEKFRSVENRLNRLLTFRRRDFARNIEVILVFFKWFNPSQYTAFWCYHEMGNVSLQHKISHVKLYIWVSLKC